MSTDPRTRQASKLAHLAWRSQTGEDPTDRELAAFVLGFSLGTHFRTPVGHAMLTARLSDHLHEAVEVMTRAITTSDLSFETDYTDEDEGEDADETLPRLAPGHDARSRLVN